ncbi:MAG: MBL fold metallo-hydrolase, partial [Bacillota bacterium]
MNDSITFLGTGGARVMMSRQLLATGGIWLSLAGVQVLLDPGPGSLVHCIKKGLTPSALDIIAISHRHLDHCG